MLFTEIILFINIDVHIQNIYKTMLYVYIYIFSSKKHIVFSYLLFIYIFITNVDPHSLPKRKQNKKLNFNNFFLNFYYFEQNCHFDIIYQFEP